MANTVKLIDETGLYMTTESGDYLILESGRGRVLIVDTGSRIYVVRSDDRTYRVTRHE